MKKILSCLAALLLLSSCNFAPKYSRPSAPVSTAFKEQPTPAAEPVAWTQAHPQDDAIRPKWWELYGEASLNGLEEQVQVSNQTLAADEAAYREARALVTEARAALFPTVSTSPSYSAFRTSANVRGGTVAAGTGAAGGTSSVGSTSGSRGQIYTLPLEATYEVDLWGRVRNTVAVNASNAQASAADLANARLSLQAQVAQDYFQIRALDEEKRILDAAAASYRRNLNIALNLFQNGIDSEEDVAQAQAQLDGAIADASDLGISRAQFEHALAVLVGRAPADFSLAPAVKFSAQPPPVPVALPSQLLERRPDIAGAERRVAAANAQIVVARAAYFPTLGLSATGGFESSHFSNWLTWPSRFWSLGPQAAETLLDFGLRRGQNAQARAAYDAAVADYRQAVLSAFQSVEDNLAALRILATEAGQRTTAANSSQHYLDLSLARFKLGIDSYLNVSSAETAYLANEESAVQIQLRRMLASVSLVMAMGGGWDVSQLPAHP